MRGAIYLDNAATSWPKPPTVASSMKSCIDSFCGNPGRGNHKMAIKCAEAVYSVREKICNMFGGPSPENVVFTQNATYALNTAIKSLVPSGHVIISDIEHNAVVRPVVSSGLKYSILSSRCEEKNLLREAEAHIESNTRAMIVNAASNICGIKLPLEKLGEICSRHGLIFIVDASQAAGKQEIDMKKCRIDALCAPGHKGLLGPQGTGFVIFSERAAKVCTRSRTLIEGGNGVNSRDAFMPDFLPERYEAGTLNVPAIVGLGEGLSFVRALGVEKIAREEDSLGAQMTRYLKTMKGITVYAEEQKPSSVVLFNIDGMNSEDAAKALDSHGIYVRAGLHCAPLAHSTLGTPETGAVRISFGVFNSFEDAARTAEVINAIKR